MLRKYNIKRIKNKPFSMLIAGSRNTGKSYLLRDIFKKCELNEHYDIIMTFSKMDDTLEFYKQFIASNLFFNKYDEEIIKNTYQIIKEEREYGREFKYLIIFDDCVGKDTRNNEQIMELYNMGRHMGISVIFITQRLKLAGVDIRDNSDFIFITKTKSAEEKKIIIDVLLSGTADEDELNGLTEKKFYNQLIKNTCINYNVIVIDTTDHNASKFNEIVFKYKAD